MSEVSVTAHCLMASQLRGSSDASVYAAVVKGARRRNDALGITGALIFDGERFCQFIEGATVALKSLFSRIERDERHVELRVLLEGTGPRLFSTWCSGYCDPGDLDPFMGPEALEGAVALQQFMTLTQRCDLAP